ncbi:MAG TPA: ion channel [Verrucomicrobiae bacterium]|nr:ion channel [Verrucomicrobiae bacterium]
MYHVLARLLRASPHRQTGLLLGLAGLCLLAGSVAFAATDHVGLGTALYWAVTTATTVGYGDVTPHNPVSRVVAVAVMVTTIPLFASVFAVLAGAAALARVRRLLHMDTRVPDHPFRLLVGDHPAISGILEELLRAHQPVVLVADIDPATLPPDVHLVRGAPTELRVLRQAHPERADQALLCGRDDGAVLVAAVLLRQLAPGLRCSALVGSATVGEALRALGVSRTVSSEDLLAHTMAKTLETPHAGELLLRLVDTDRYRLAEVPAEAASVGAPLSRVRQSAPGLVLGLVQGDRVTVGVAHDPVVTAGDQLLVLRAMSEGG